MRRAKVVNRSQVEGKRKFRGKSGEAGASVSSRQVALVSPGWQESWIWQTCLCILHTWNIHSPPDCPLTQPCRDPARVSLSVDTPPFEPWANSLLLFLSYFHCTPFSSFLLLVFTLPSAPIPPCLEDNSNINRSSWPTLSIKLIPLRIPAIISLLLESSEPEETINLELSV